eukprot:14756845-Alexandrium_andersonii.AAC.1
MRPLGRKHGNSYSGVPQQRRAGEKEREGGAVGMALRLDSNDAGKWDTRQDQPAAGVEEHSL